MTKTVIDLVRAVLNATLILLALCLFLAWKLIATADAVTARASQIAGAVAPLTTAVTELQQEMAEVRGAVQATPETGTAHRLSRIEARLENIQTHLNALRTLPQEAAAQAAQAGAADLAGRLISTAAWIRQDGSCAATGN